MMPSASTRYEAPSASSATSAPRRRRSGHLVDRRAGFFSVRSLAGCGVAGSNWLEFTPARPRHSPRTRSSSSGSRGAGRVKGVVHRRVTSRRGYCPTVPRSPRPPGMTMPSSSADAAPVRQEDLRLLDLDPGRSPRSAGIIETAVLDGLGHPRGQASYLHTYFSMIPIQPTARIDHDSIRWTRISQLAEVRVDHVEPQDVAHDIVEHLLMKDLAGSRQG